jgi:DNA repair exonuclease SbcCD ATPase subunit
MKIVKLTAENVKRLIAVEITPEGTVITIGGKNGAGKSSVLDSIAFALGGKTLVPDMPIRKGKKTARIEVDLGEFIVIRNFDEGGSSIVIKNKEGLTYSSPQKMLDKLVGKLTFDPLAFVHSSEKDQQSTLRTLVGLDTTMLDNQRKILYDNRTVLNRELKQQESYIEDLSQFDGVPKEPISMEEISKRMLEAEEARKLQIRMKEEETRAKEMLAEYKATKKMILQDIEKLDKDIVNVELTMKKMVPVEVPDITEIQKRLTEIEDINAKVRKNQLYFQQAEELVRIMKEVEEKNSKIQEIDEKKKEMLKKAKYPISGLKLGEDGVVFNDIPFKQCSTAEQLRVSVAMGLALNPELKILLVRDGNALDAFSLKEVAKMAEEANAQLWLERVSEDGEGVSIMIEEGKVVFPKPTDQELKSKG